MDFSNISLFSYGWCNQTWLVTRLPCNLVGGATWLSPGSYNRRGLRQPKIFAPASARGPRRGPLAVAPAKIFGWLKHPNHHYPKIQTCNQIWLQTDKLMGGTTFPITDWPWDSVKIYLFSNNYPFLAHLPCQPLDVSSHPLHILFSVLQNRLVQFEIVLKRLPAIVQIFLPKLELTSTYCVNLCSHFTGALIERL